MSLIILSIFLFLKKKYNIKKYFYTRSGIRTHEAEATDLKSVPFDRSGIRVYARSGIRTHEPEGTDLKSVAFDRSAIPVKKH